MKKIILLCLLFTATFVQAQMLPISFEGDVTLADFEDFDGGIASVIPNPQSNGINTSATVAQIVRDGGAQWSGSKILLDANLDFTTNNEITMKVFTTAPVGTVVKFKLEGNGATERDVTTTVSGQWETLTWDFTGTPTDFNYLVFMFDFGNVGDGSENSTFLFDDVEQLFGGEQIDWPATFEGAVINHTVTDFGGNASTRVTSPTNPNNKVIQTIKTNTAATWAGTTIGTPAGFATNLPLTLTDSKMTVRVWSPTAGTPIRLKVEDHSDPTHTCETETNTTLAGEWETMYFDFTNQAPGTESLEVGLNMGWTYNMASIFFNFGTEGSVAGETTYYFDDVYFGEVVLSTEAIAIENLNVSPNPSSDLWTISVKDELIVSVQLFDLQGRLLLSQKGNDAVVNIDGSALSSGLYIAKVSTERGTGSIRLIKE